MSSSAHNTRDQLEQRLRRQRDQLDAALNALSQLEHPPHDISAALTTLNATSLQLNNALQLADDLAAWCATFEASQTAQQQTHHTPHAHHTPHTSQARHAPAWLEPLHSWAEQQQPQPWSFSGHAPRWQLGMISLIQADNRAQLELWLGDKHEYLCELPADSHTLITYLDAFVTRPLPTGFVAALQDSIHTLAGNQPTAPVLEVLGLLEQRLGSALNTHLSDHLPDHLLDHLSDHLPDCYSPAMFAFDIFRVKSEAKLRFIAASRAQKQRLWLPQDYQGRGMVCGWLAC